MKFVINHSKEPFGIELAKKIVLYHSRYGPTIPEHQGYCGHGFMYSQGYCLSKNNKNFQYNEMVGIVRVHEYYYQPVKIFSINNYYPHRNASKLFIEWFSKQSDYSMSGFSTDPEDLLFSYDPRIERIKKEMLVKLTQNINLNEDIRL